MAFSDLAQQLNDACINTFGTTAQLYPQSQPGTPTTINGIFEKPAFLEEVMPGLGVSVMRFFVGTQDITPAPLLGDVLEVNNAQYDVWEIEVDSTGGATLKLRIRD